MPDKIQLKAPFNYLGHVMEESKIKPQKSQISVQSQYTLNDFQKLLGDINWLWSSVEIPTYALQNLFKILEGSLNLNSPRHLTKEAREELALMEEHIQQSFSTQLDHDQPVSLYIFPAEHLPTAIIAQHSPTEWVYLHTKQSKKIISYIEKIGQLIMSGRSHIQPCTGFDPYAIHVPLTKTELQIGLQYNLTMQMALNDFQNVISFHLPKGKLWDFLQCTKFIITNIIASQPISNAPTYFIDGNKKGITGIVGPDIKEKLPTTYSSVQRVEFYALYALLSLQPLYFNVYTDSKYLASFFPDFVTTFLYNLDEELYIFSQTQALILSCTEPFFIAHIRAHSGLPGPLVAENDAVDSLIAPIFTSASDEHANLHTNANRLLKPVMSVLLCIYGLRFQELIPGGNSLIPFVNLTSLTAP